jgi:aerobic-type carbon monoxide dehydrogenase small subunit (CoxS/CutS family)
MARIFLKVNGKSHTFDVDPQPHCSMYFLELNGPRFGCGLAQCGACTGLVEAIRSFVTPVRTVENKPITTLEGLGSQANRLYSGSGKGNRSRHFPVSAPHR